MQTSERRKQYVIQETGLNALSAFIKNILANDLPQLEKLLGKKIVNADDNTSKKFIVEKYVGKDQKQKDHVITERYYYSPRKYQLDISVRVVLSYEGHAYYFEKSVPLGNLQDGTLTEVYSLTYILQNNTSLAKEIKAEEIIKTIELFEQKKEELREIYNSIPRITRDQFNISM